MGDNEQKGTPVDLTRWNRKERRNFAKQAHMTIPGRNMPYVKQTHGTVAAYNELRSTEVSQDKNNG